MLKERKWQSRFFDFFSKTALTILMKLGQNVELIKNAKCENRMSKKIAVLEIFFHKVQILAKNGKSGV